MIPRTIHYCWFGSESQSQLIRKCLASWRTFMPDCAIKLWDETNSPLGGDYARAAYAQEEWSRLTNFVRFHALYTEGGIYLDTDVEMLRSLDPLLTDHCFLGFQQKEDLVDWVNTAVLAGEAGHPFLKACLDRFTDAFRETGQFLRSPGVATAVLREMGLKTYGRQVIGGVTLYPTEYFYPYSWLEKYSPERISPDTYCVHHWAASWKKKPAFELPPPLRRVK